MPFNGPALGALGIGSIFLYSAIKGKSVLATAQAIITGKSPATVSQTAGIVNSSVTSSTNSDVTSSNAQGGSAAQNQAIAKQLAKNYGWDSGAEWNALVSLWNSESNWSNTIWNTSASCGNDSYAYGIVQACGHGISTNIPGHGSVCPYPSGNAGNPPGPCGGTSNASAQIEWGLAYIKQNYGSPVNVPHGGY